MERQVRAEEARPPVPASSIAQAAMHAAAAAAAGRAASSATPAAHPISHIAVRPPSDASRFTHRHIVFLGCACSRQSLSELRSDGSVFQCYHLFPKCLLHAPS
jgi:hypothetical protein